MNIAPEMGETTFVTSSASFCHHHHLLFSIFFVITIISSSAPFCHLQHFYHHDHHHHHHILSTVPPSRPSSRPPPRPPGERIMISGSRDTLEELFPEIASTLQDARHTLTWNSSSKYVIRSSKSFNVHQNQGGKYLQTYSYLQCCQGLIFNQLVYKLSGKSDAN